MPLKIIKTEDGSESLYNEEMNETYHSTKGARSESEYVFIDKALNYWVESNSDCKQISILEVGFGTGLNAWLTWQWAEKNQKSVQMVSLEPYPIPEDVRKQMDLAKDIRFNLMHGSEWNLPVKFNDYFSLEKRNMGVADLKDLNSYNVVFFDAFAPSKQPEMWSADNLRICHANLKSGGILTTYCAQGQFKRNLAEVGFEVEVLPGALGKKEMVRGLRT